MPKILGGGEKWIVLRAKRLIGIEWDNALDSRWIEYPVIRHQHVLRIMESVIDARRKIVM